MSKEVLDAFAGGSDELDGPQDTIKDGNPTIYGNCWRKAGQPHACDVGMLIICTETNDGKDCDLGYRLDPDGTRHVNPGVCLLEEQPHDGPSL